MNKALTLAFAALFATASLQANAAVTTKAKTPVRAAAKKPVAPPPAPAPLPDADTEQLEAAQLAYLGHYECEFKQSIEIESHPTHPGYINVRLLKQLFTMKPVRSITGALRLEDVTGRTLMIQIANKSMLLDVNAGQRLVDDCVSPAQRELMAKLAAERAAREASGETVTDSGLGLGK